MFLILVKEKVRLRNCLFNSVIDRNVVGSKETTELFSRTCHKSETGKVGTAVHDCHLVVAPGSPIRTTAKYTAQKK